MAGMVNDARPNHMMRASSAVCLRAKVALCVCGGCPAGNDLSRSFKWGAEFDWRWIKGHASVYSTLKRVS
jgi:hypothetical protein